jgi:UBX domain-containing protein 1
VPTGAEANVTANSMPGSFPGAAAAATNSSSVTPERESISTRFEVDHTAPTTSVQIRLADGTRYVVHFFSLF